jgi:hypothetical protein
MTKCHVTKCHDKTAEVVPVKKVDTSRRRADRAAAVEVGGEVVEAAAVEAQAVGVRRSRAEVVAEVVEAVGVRRSAQAVEVEARDRARAASETVR